MEVVDHALKRVSANCKRWKWGAAEATTTSRGIEASKPLVSGVWLMECRRADRCRNRAAQANRISVFQRRDLRGRPSAHCL